MDRLRPNLFSDKSGQRWPLPPELSANGEPGLAGRAQRPGLATVPIRPTGADVRFDTFGFGFLHHFNPHLKAVVYYDIIRNEKTNLTGFQKDIADNIFTIRTQFHF